LGQASFRILSNIFEQGHSLHINLFRLAYYLSGQKIQMCIATDSGAR
jgi:hypothetical protein